MPAVAAIVQELHILTVVLDIYYFVALALVDSAFRVGTFDVGDAGKGWVMLYIRRHKRFVSNLRCIKLGLVRDHYA